MCVESVRALTQRQDIVAIGRGGNALNAALWRVASADKWTKR